MQLTDVLYFIVKVAAVLFTTSLVLFSYRLIYLLYGFKKPKTFKDTEKKGKYAILVAARDESAVIEALLKSIKNQTYDKEYFDVFVVTETEDDPTNKIVERYKYNYFVRKDLENKHTKGFALDEVVKDIYAKNLKYDAFFIIDADNTIAPNYIEEMNKAYQSGVEVGMSYKNVTNINDNWVSCCSALLFSNVNTFQNKAKTRISKTMLISGTGLYISSKIMDEFRGFPFTTLTEDYELSNYLASHKVKVDYIETTDVYVQQPVKLSTVNKQRTRWVRGFLDVNGKLIKEERNNKNKRNKFVYLGYRLAIIPNIVFIATMILYVLALIGLAIAALAMQNYSVLQLTAYWLFGFLLTYQVLLMAYTGLQFLAERKHLKISKKNILLAILLNPFFINLFIPQAIVALFNKNIGWKKIERTKTEVDVVEGQAGVKNG